MNILIATIIELCLI